MPDDKRVLIIDPSALFRHLLKKMIQTRYPQMTITESDRLDRTGEDKDPWDGRPPDIVFIDHSTSFTNGITTIEALKRERPETLVVVMALNDSKEHRAASLKAGADFFFSKNYSGCSRLVEFLETFLFNAQNQNPETHDPSFI